jgi:lipopolysaccharide export system protein LptC
MNRGPCPRSIYAYQRRIFWFRRIAPLLTLIAITTIFGWSSLEKWFTWFSNVSKPTEIHQKIIMRNSLIKPEIHSIDKQGRSYRIQAKRADHRGKEETIFKDTHSQVKDKNGDTLNITAPEGYFFDQSKTIIYKGGVTITSSQGHYLQTPKISMTMNNQKISSQGPVQGFGPQGHVQSKGLIVDPKKNIMKFTGQTHMTIRGQKGRMASP